MTTSTVVLIVIAVVVALILIGVVVATRYQLRAERRLLGGTSLLDEVAEDARIAQQSDEANPKD